MESTSMDERRVESDRAVAGAKWLPPGLRELLDHLARGLKELYGVRYRGLILYGSYARGAADEGSDVDLLLLLEGQINPARELKRTQAVKWPLALEADYAVFLLPISVDDYERSDDPFLWNVRREGIRAA